ncbi:MAG: DEAD/DEAH box helicase [Chloroflexi bacterium]|nr:DEAD/DEAH box helicase [Chloroflexota bacterium]
MDPNPALTPATTVQLALAGNDLALRPADRDLPALAARLADLGVPTVVDRHRGALRAAAGCYARLRASGLPLEVAFDDHPALSFGPSPVLLPRDYQRAAVDAWLAAGGSGVVELPTGAGKTYVGVLAIAALDLRTLVVVPTIDLLEQWRRALCELLPAPPEAVGVLGGGEHRPAEITVTTYQSALIYPRELARYGLLICDEVHHLPADSFRRITQGAWARHRLGLTATAERSDGRHVDLEELLGPVVYRRSPGELTRSGSLARYREERRYVSLSTEEAERHARAVRTVREYLRTVRLPASRRAGRGVYELLVQRSAGDPRAREALLAYQEARTIAWNAAAKVEVVERILQRHRAEPVLIFCESNEMVARLARTFLIPAVTHETPHEERRWVLSALRSGAISKVVTGRVLNEGVDLPAVAVAVLLSGNSTRLEYVQRLGRILRPKEGEAVLYEVLTRNTGELGQSARRHAGLSTED